MVDGQGQDSRRSGSRLHGLAEIERRRVKDVGLATGLPSLFESLAELLETPGAALGGRGLVRTLAAAGAETLAPRLAPLLAIGLHTSTAAEPTALETTTAGSALHPAASHLSGPLEASPRTLPPDGAAAAEATGHGWTAESVLPETTATHEPAATETIVSPAAEARTGERIAEAPPRPPPRERPAGPRPGSPSREESIRAESRSASPERSANATHATTPATRHEATGSLGPLESEPRPPPAGSEAASEQRPPGQGAASLLHELPVALGARRTESRATASAVGHGTHAVTESAPPASALAHSAIPPPATALVVVGQGRSFGVGGRRFRLDRRSRGIDRRSHLLLRKDRAAHEAEHGQGQAQAHDGFHGVVHFLSNLLCSSRSRRRREGFPVCQSNVRDGPYGVTSGSPAREERVPSEW